MVMERGAVVVGGLWVGQAALLLFFLLPPSLSGQESGWSATEAMALPIPLPFPSLIDFEFRPPIAGSLPPCVSYPLHLFTALCPFLESWGMPGKSGGDALE